MNETEVIGYLEPPEPDTKIVAMTEHAGTIFVATERRVYRLQDGKFYPMLFVADPAGMLGPST